MEEIEIYLDSPEKTARFINVCSTFNGDIDLLSGSRILVDAKSIVSVFACELSHPVKVRIVTFDLDEEKRFKEAMKEFE